jgi:hypothetical protein
MSRTTRADRSAYGSVVAALGDQDAEQDANPDDEPRKVAPAAVRLPEDPLVDHLQGTGDRQAPYESDDYTEDDWASRVGRRVPEQVFDDVGASTVEAEVAAQVVVDPFVGDRAEEDDQRQHRQEQCGSEEDDRVYEVDRLQ